MSGLRTILRPRWPAVFAALAFGLLVVAPAVALQGDQDGDTDIDLDDIAIILAARNTPAATPTDPRDLDFDGTITILDGRIAATRCTRLLCASGPGDPCLSFQALPPAVDDPFQPATPPQTVADGSEASIFFANTTVAGVTTGSELSDSARAALARIAEAMKSSLYINSKYILEGHTAECGSNEANLLLGQMRAEAVQGYLQALGIGSSRVQVVSYGEERPFCTDQTLSCWQTNSQVRFVQVGE